MKYKSKRKKAHATPGHFVLPIKNCFIYPKFKAHEFLMTDQVSKCKPFFRITDRSNFTSNFLWSKCIEG